MKKEIYFTYLRIKGSLQVLIKWGGEENRVGTSSKCVLVVILPDESASLVGVPLFPCYIISQSLLVIMHNGGTIIIIV